MTVQILALVGLVLGVALYALLVRRRAAERFDMFSMPRALALSNEIALQRIRNGPRDRAGVRDAVEDRAEAVAMSGEPRAESDQPFGQQVPRGRGRRWGGGRRRGRRR